MISQYVKDKNGMKIGAMVAIKKNGEIAIGYSKWNSKLDKYNPKLGMKIAIERAKKDRGKATPAKSMKDEIINFIGRSMLYYRTEVLTKNTKKTMGDFLGIKYED